MVKSVPLSVPLSQNLVFRPFLQTSLTKGANETFFCILDFPRQCLRSPEERKKKLQSHSALFFPSIDCTIVGLFGSEKAIASAVCWCTCLKYTMKLSIEEIMLKISWLYLSKKFRPTQVLDNIRKYFFVRSDQYLFIFKA